MNFFAIHSFFGAFAVADFFGKLVFLGLFGLSLVCWVFLLYKIWMMRTIKRISFSFKHLVEKNRDTLLTLPINTLPAMRKKRLPHPLFQLFLVLKEKTMEILDKNRFFSSPSPETQNHYLSRTDIEFIDSHLQATIAKQRALIEKNLFILSTTITLAPFLGLLGTVWGILITFGELQAGHSVTSNTIILGGLSTALTTTVLGLVIAIPALIAYNCLKNASRSFALEMDDFSHFLLSTVELQYRKVDVNDHNA